MSSFAALPDSRCPRFPLSATTAWFRGFPTCKRFPLHRLSMNSTAQTSLYFALRPCLTSFRTLGQALLVEEGARSHREASEEYYKSEREVTQARHTVEEIEVRFLCHSATESYHCARRPAVPPSCCMRSCTPALL